MEKPVISAKNLTKTYPLYKKHSDRLREIFFPWRKYHALFYALQDISFDLYRGEHLGILGVNGAGKSTLLQILTGVLTPSSGSVVCEGRIAALLELGAGFNPELTGRENAKFLLEMSESNVDVLLKKVASVAEFADIGQFFDQPVKLYSSGMFVRVAFAANIMSDPDILIIDEALSVGDARFQKKCIDYMNRLKSNGATIILVTHDIFTAKMFCSHLLLLHQGRLIENGEPEKVATKYYQLLFPENVSDSEKIGKYRFKSDVLPSPTSDYILTANPNSSTPKWGHGGVSLSEVRIYGLRPPNFLTQGQHIAFELDYFFDSKKIETLCCEHRVLANLLIGIRMDSAQGVVLFDLASVALDESTINFDVRTENRATFRIECLLPILAPGDYFLTPGVAIGTHLQYVPLCGYDNLIHLFQDPGKLVLGQIRPQYSVRRIN